MHGGACEKLGARAINWWGMKPKAFAGSGQTTCRSVLVRLAVWICLEIIGECFCVW